MKARVGASGRKNRAIIASDVVLGLDARHSKRVGRWRIGLRALAERKRREDGEKRDFHADRRWFV
jgi:hypothetical protein